MLHHARFDIAPARLSAHQESGSGKSVTEMREHRSHGVAMVFQNQDAHINPVHTIGDLLRDAPPGVRGPRRKASSRRADPADLGFDDGEGHLPEYPWAACFSR